MFVGDGTNVSAYGADEYSGDIRFNGAGLGWGDISYYPNGGGNGNGGQFRFTLNGSTVVPIPNAKVGVGSLYSAANVGIGTASPGYLLHVNGDAGKPGGGSWSNASDIRLKKNVEDLKGVLGKLLKLRPVSFEYKDAEAIKELPGTQVGMIAQEVEQVFPQWVDEAADGYKRLTFRGFEALVVEALRELRDEKDAKIASLEERLERLERAANVNLVRFTSVSE
jgi:hypothetical protein